jgi:pilus assembly protein FimV
MSSGKNPLMLMMALSMPGASHALGLGDIHVASGLNERLAAEIDILGATADDLADLRAAVANRETFLRYGADRPAFLSSATFKVTQDNRGRPVLAIRSTESFTDPVVNFLVDLRWRKGELVREYTLLLDPPGFASAPLASVPLASAPLASAPLASAPLAPAAPDVPAVPPAAMPVVETKTQTVARQVDPPTHQPNTTSTDRSARRTTHIKVGAKATLRGIAWRVGERSESDLQRMMIAIFRANPNAFEGNINRLHLGAVLTIPSHVELEAISKAEASREFHAQMAAWHSPAAASGATRATASSATPVVTSVAGAPTQTTSPSSAADSLATDELGRRVQSMERELSQMKGVLDSELDQLLNLQKQAARADQAAAAVEAPRANQASQPAQVPQAVQAARAQPTRGNAALASILAGLGLLAAGFGALYYRSRRPAATPKGSLREAHTAAPTADVVTADGITDFRLDGTAAGSRLDAMAVGGAPSQEQYLVPEPAQRRASDDAREIDGTAAAAILDDATHPMLPLISVREPSGRGDTAIGAVSHDSAQDATARLHVGTDSLYADATKLDYNLQDLDLTVQHVQMPSVLNEHAVVKERRTNLADVLKLAIEREPDRHDLRMKLLELYYSAAATNRKAFLEVVQKFARDRDYLHTEQWDKIAYMGRQIASDNPMFAEESADDEDLANCA